MDSLITDGATAIVSNCPPPPSISVLALQTGDKSQIWNENFVEKSIHWNITPFFCVCGDWNRSLFGKWRGINRLLRAALVKPKWNQVDFNWSFVWFLTRVSFIIIFFLIWLILSYFYFIPFLCGNDKYFGKRRVSILPETVSFLEECWFFPPPRVSLRLFCCICCSDPLQLAPTKRSKKRNNEGKRHSREEGRRKRISGGK